MATAPIARPQARNARGAYVPTAADCKNTGTDDHNDDARRQPPGAECTHQARIALVAGHGRRSSMSGSGARSICCSGRGGCNRCLRPEAINAINEQMRRDIPRVLSALDEDRVIGGPGSRSGADSAWALTSRSSVPRGSAPRARGSAWLEVFAREAKPEIAVNRHCTLTKEQRPIETSCLEPK